MRLGGWRLEGGSRGMERDGLGPTHANVVAGERMIVLGSGVNDLFQHLMLIRVLDEFFSGVFVVALLDAGVSVEDRSRLPTGEEGFVTAVAVEAAAIAVSEGAFTPA